MIVPSFDNSSTNDRNFDDIADHFEKKIYGSGKSYKKGLLRQKVIRRDLAEEIPGLFIQPGKQPLKLLDVGAGLGQFCIELAKLGHQVTYNDISKAMMQKAQLAAKDEHVEDTIIWLNTPYQALAEHYEQYDLVLCHALLEWLENPLAAIELLGKLLRSGGVLSLCVYNPAGKIMRNLICGNFKSLENSTQAKPKGRSLTPISSPELSDIEQAFYRQGFELIRKSGIRVFSDYVLEKRGGNQFDDEVIKMELTYSENQSLVGAARYVHYVLRMK